MTSILQGTTPYILTAVEGYDLTNAQAIWVTLKNKGRLYNFTGERVSTSLDGEDTVLAIHLTQEETLKFQEPVISIQVRWKAENGEVYGTEPICDLPIREVFYKAVI